MNYSEMPREAHITIADISTSKTRGREHRGLTPLSPQTIRRLESKGLFPASRKYTDAKGRYYILGEVLDWLAQQNEANVT